MILAKQGKQIPKNLFHDPTLKNNDGETVAILYAKNGLIPPKEWHHDPSVHDAFGSSVYSNLVGWDK